MAGENGGFRQSFLVFGSHLSFLPAFSRFHQAIFGFCKPFLCLAEPFILFAKRFFVFVSRYSFSPAVFRFRKAISRFRQPFRLLACRFSRSPCHFFFSLSHFSFCHPFPVLRKSFLLFFSLGFSPAHLGKSLPI